MNVSRALVLAAVPLVLSACSTTSGSTATPQVQTFDSLQGYFNYTDQILADIGDSYFDEPSELQPGGRSQYVGVMEIGDDLGVLAAGALSLNVNFSDSTVSGTASDFVDFEDLPVSGQLNITNGNIDRNADLVYEYTFVADMDGRLTTTPREVIDVSSVIFGDFFQDQAYVTGGATGEYTLNGVDYPMSGFFAAER
ncbi:hypothetical protein [Flavimaricola marinus]|uniref:Transferrin-binding protein B C-lobe/N-lobe beta barrel domain-containing protein n=1 Tax=Flavimaricola marinus TaxID=1819565 RepID=A0A238LE38_9RHOB|nr:hypothetical protein [Flavimaricola marinus]SMY07813.1 hypothetical protein LOM8899_01953 [Flavimaricola marinus]